MAYRGIYLKKLKKIEKIIKNLISFDLQILGGSVQNK